MSYPHVMEKKTTSVLQIMQYFTYTIDIYEQRVRQIHANSPIKAVHHFDVELSCKQAFIVERRPMNIL